MKNIIPIINFVIFSTVAISEKEKQLRVLLKQPTQEDSKDGYELPFTNLEDDMDVDKSSYNFLQSITTSAIKLKPLGTSTDPLLSNNDGDRFIKFSFYCVVQEDVADELSKDNLYQWIDLSDDFPKLTSEYKFSQDIEKSFVIIGKELKGVELIETILEFLPNKFKSKDAEYVAKLFNKERKDMFVFFRYLREQSKPDEIKTNRKHIKVGQKIRISSDKEAPKGKGSGIKGKPSIIYEKITS